MAKKTLDERIVQAQQAVMKLDRRIGGLMTRRVDIEEKLAKLYRQQRNRTAPEES